MKKVISLIVISLFVMVNGVCKTNMSFISVTSAKTTEDSKIDLSGNFLTTGTRSIFEPIILMQYSGYLGVTYTSNFGDITVQIYDEQNNIVYQNLIDTSMERQLYINTKNLTAGNYFIRFLNSRKESLTGIFNIQ